jgi:hypothetical protein
MSWILAIVIIAILYFVIKSKRKSDNNHFEEDNNNSIEEYDDDDSFTISVVEHYGYSPDKQGSLSKEATKLKKEGDLEGAVKKIDEAISIEPSNALVYKKAYYLQLDNKFDEAWKIMESYTSSVRGSILKSNDWKSLRFILIEYASCEENLIKLLKKEKKIKDVLYYSPASEYYNLLALGTSHLNDFESALNEHKSGSVSDRKKIKTKDYNLENFDSKYREFISNNNDAIQQFSDDAMGSDIQYYLKDIDYDEEFHDKLHKIQEDAKPAITKCSSDAVKTLKEIICKGIELSDNCYKAAENKL